MVEGLTFPLTDEQFKGLVDLLDPECSGVINYGQFIELCQNRPTSGPMVTIDWLDKKDSDNKMTQHLF